MKHLHKLTFHSHSTAYDLRRAGQHCTPLLKQLLGTLIAACGISSGIAQTHQTADEINADIKKNGPYNQREFARIVGAAIQPPTPSVQAIPGKFIVNAAARETNELIVLLNYSSQDRLTQVASGLKPGATAPTVERAFLAATAARSPNVDFALGSPLHVRYMLDNDRMTDATRAEQSAITPEARASGFAYNPRERLERYFVVRYDSIELAKLASERMKKDALFEIVQSNGVPTLSTAPNDAYFSVDTNFKYYQWGTHSMNFPAAWDITSGQSYIGVMDAGFPGAALGANLVVHPDLKKNFRQHMLSVSIQTNYANGLQGHTVHVSGIIAAQHNNGTGGDTGWIAGACPECSFVTYPWALVANGDDSALAVRLTEAIDGGMQVINWSGGYPNDDCSTKAAICDAMRLASYRGVLVVVASGNSNQSSGPDFPGNAESIGYSWPVLPVGGTTPTGTRWDTGTTGLESGSNWASYYGVMAPAQSIASTFIAGDDYNYLHSCTDQYPDYDESAGRFLSTGVGDGVGSCTGTSMSAPYISALAGMVISVNPRVTATNVRNLIRQSGHLAWAPNAQYGYGSPNAVLAVSSALATNPRRLTPLFSYYSINRQDSFYTTAPQMARSAAYGKMRPTLVGSTYWQNTYSASYYGTPITGYVFPENGPSFGGDMSTTARAEVWIFTTASNPKSTSVPLRPIYRMSWMCGDPTPYPPAVCSSAPFHLDSILVGKDEIAVFSSWGYKVDGLEGYVYPPEMAQPPGTVKLMRKYNPNRDDHASFPDTKTASMLSQGYTAYSNYSDWLGYVYPNTGPVPAIP